MSRLLAWYGDDFTGSTDVLEALSLQGIRSVLFLRQPPSLQPFHDYEAFGLAGSSRGQSPVWMERHLPAAFDWLGSLQTPVVHYKVCSTFDSSPETGNIGRAMEIGQRVLRTSWVPVVVGAPPLRRYTAFGNLFAGAGSEIHRIDRHPTMSRHPVTPMREADLRLHLAHQTATPVELLNCLEIRDPAILEARRNQSPFVLIDVVDEQALAPVGALLWTAAQRERLFVVGSSGVQYALAAHWKRPVRPQVQLSPVEQLLVLSGSCSPVTAEQIHHARSHGFAALDLLAGDGVLEKAEAALRNGESVVLYSASGPDSQRFDIDRHELAERSGRLLTALLDRVPVRRVVVAGGDTSSAAGALLDIDALTFVAPVAPGAPLCRAWSSNPRRHGLEIIFKGGQCGSPAFFSQVKGDFYNHV
ncbi:MAG TPA: four-carbon acid sugar kinase family protein [Bryobacteraceae bacterium]|nr:four-carbon acid sugar kinase family protein [Bryobacteraceae bacterium]